MAYPDREVSHLVRKFADAQVGVLQQSRFLFQVGGVLLDRVELLGCACSLITQTSDLRTQVLTDVTLRNRYIVSDSLVSCKYKIQSALFTPHLSPQIIL